MSSALEANPSAAAVLPSTLQSVGAQNIGESSRATATVTSTTVQISFTKDGDTWVASSSMPTITIPFDELDEIIWTLVRPTALGSNEPLHFDDHPISFPSDQGQAPMVVINSAAGSTNLIAIWANVDSNTAGTYSYTLNMRIADQLVAHDPTVENIPPTQ